ncbi:hypothetical protein PHLGIDRAFT_20045 [Phlebiopsis gigantea 11061_1 CR5-6]|uniref:Uncharacterized protein n=1 Tax=Phlebiopsis gigantea (strain 11061_1 CR5-6) TaxID=745531 RepID=A0A0C3S339_PHLG1|nr:hypothetical protein PHLGIDRAFT_20045 [Phlebiopsis gigantea 11061_1 CR5-6]
MRDLEGVEHPDLMETSTSDEQTRLQDTGIGFRGVLSLVCACVCIVVSRGSCSRLSLGRRRYRYTDITP